MLTIITLAVMIVGLASLAVWSIVQERRASAARAQRRAFVRWQQRQSEQRIQRLTHAAFDAMLREARPRSPEKQDDPWRG